MTAFAGRFAPRGGGSEAWRPRLEAALARDGPAASCATGPLALAWTPAAEDAGRRVVCVVDGLPEPRRLADELGLDPAAPLERLLATGYERLGAGVVARLDGDFALVLWDREAEHGVLARDRAGARPQFVADAGGALLFASEIRNLLPLLATRPAPDDVAVAHWLARTSYRGDRTLYSGVRRLPPAATIVLGGGTREPRRHWRPRYAPPRQIGREDAAAEIRAAVTGAVERALTGSERPGVMLSGGLDSAAVAVEAAPRGAVAYSSVFPAAPEVDESGRIARVRDWLGMRGVEDEFTGGSALAAGAEFLATWEVPSVTPNLFVWVPLLRRAAADGVDVMLDGEGGDELFGCAPYLVADALRAGRPRAALRLVRRLPGMGADPRSRWVARALGRYGVRGALPRRAHEPLRRLRRRRRLPGWLGADPARAHAEGDDPWAWKLRGGPRWWAQLADALTDAVDAIGAADQLRREGALCGLELRHPLRDPRLAELVLTLPPELAFDPDLDRPLARLAFAGALPDDVLGDDTKPDFNSLPAGALAGPDAGELERLVADMHPELARRVRLDAVRALVADTPAERRPPAWPLDVWRIAALELWLRHQSEPVPA